MESAEPVAREVSRTGVRGGTKALLGERPGTKRGRESPWSRWLGGLLLLTTACWGAAIDETPPTWGSLVGLQAARGTRSGAFERSFSVANAADPLLGSGAVSLRWGQGVSLFGPQAGASQAAWSLGWQTDAATHKGLGGSVYLAETPNLPGSAAAGFAADELGLRRADLRLSWKDGSSSLLVGRDRASSLEAARGLTRDVLGAEALGLTYRRERVAVDAGAVFDPAVGARLLGDQGYGLGGRKLGDASAGWATLQGLAGLVDRSEQLGFTHGSLKLAQNDRRLTRDGATLHDFNQSLSLGGLSLTHATRSLDSEFNGWREAGYAHWGRLVGGREDVLGAAFDSKRFGAAWTRTDLRTGMATPTATQTTKTDEARLRWDPNPAVHLAWSRVAHAQGATADFAAKPTALTHDDANHLEAGWHNAVHTLGFRLEQTHSGSSAQRHQGHEVEFGYGYGARTKLAWRESWGGTTATGDASPATPEHGQRLSLDTAFGLSLVREKQSTGSTSSRHDGAKLDHKLLRRVQVQAGVDRWRNATAPGLVLAGRAGLLDAPLPRATGVNVAATFTPGTTQITLSNRWLAWHADSVVAGCDAGDHRLSETSLALAQPVARGFGLRGEWTVYRLDGRQDRDRREVALVYAPAHNPLLPTAEVGYRELRSGAATGAASGHGRGTPFVRLKLQPSKGTAVEAALALAQADQADTLRWHNGQSEAVQVNASQTLGKDGSLAATYTVTPRTGVAPAAAGGDAPNARGMTVDLATPSQALGGLTIKGHWDRQTEPAGGAAPEQVRTNWKAGLAWKQGTSQELTADVAMQAADLGTGPTQSARLDVSYSASLGQDGKLSLTGCWRGDTSSLAFTPDYETYRVGLLYNGTF